MTYTEFKTYAASKFNGFSVAELQTAVKNLSSNFENGAGDVLNVALEVLESKISETDFVRFCESI